MNFGYLLCSFFFQVAKFVVAPECAHGWVLDAFPATLSQAQELDKILTQAQQPLHRVFYFSAPTDQVPAY